MSAFEECLHDWRDDGTCAHCIAVSGKVAMTYSALLNERTARLDECEMQLADTKRLLDLRERQLAECTRAMRDAAEALHVVACKGDNVTQTVANELYRVHDMLYAVRAGKGAQ